MNSLRCPNEFRDEHSEVFLPRGAVPVTHSSSPYTEMKLCSRVIDGIGCSEMRKITDEQQTESGEENAISVPRCRIWVKFEPQFRTRNIESLFEYGPETSSTRRSGTNLIQLRIRVNLVHSANRFLISRR